VLSGTIAFTDPARGSAIIAVNGSPARLYLAGSDLPDGARLSQVFPEYVLLARGGATEMLRLPRKIGPGAGMLLAAAGEESRAVGAPVDFGLPAATRNPRDFSAIRRWFGGFSGRQAPSPDGQFHGLLVRPMPRYRREYDLRDGDVIKAINGVPLEDADTAGQVLQQARGASVSLTVLRKEGTTEELTLKVGS
jgi:general secretion pathway protein C